ncbi:MAG: polysaccharide deacetylase family protein [Bacteroidetes bacterium]|nr:polysaccharide deacetylase family protein [Bacteroidota bacterium]
MIVIATENKSARLEYIASVLFDGILKVDYMVIGLSEINSTMGRYPASSLIYYLKENPYGLGDTVIPNEGLLDEETISPKVVKFEEGELLRLHFTAQPKTNFTFGFDIFSAAFYLLTEYEKYTSPKMDKHGRYKWNSYEVYKKNYHQQPLLEVYAQHILKLLKDKNPLLPEAGNNYFDYKITIDIDNPYLFKGKSKKILKGGILKDILFMRFANLKARLKFMEDSKDPYDVYDFIDANFPKKKTHFFFLCDGNSGHDGRYKATQPLYKNLIQRIAKKYEVGVHPSYNSATNAGMIKQQKELLEEVTSKPITTARMHFVKYKLPDTFHHLLAAGITDDYSICNYSSVGFPTFIARPYLWFDLVANKQTTLTIHPAFVMDRTMLSYLQQSPNEALETFKIYLQRCFRYAGTFTFIMHNEALSNHAEWEGWRDVIMQMIYELKQLKTEEN